jgi:hypothetical protein
MHSGDGALVEGIFPYCGCCKSCHRSCERFEPEAKAIPEVVTDMEMSDLLVLVVIIVAVVRMLPPMLDVAVELQSNPLSCHLYLLSALHYPLEKENQCNL